MGTPPMTEGLRNVLVEGDHEPLGAAEERDTVSQAAAGDERAYERLLQAYAPTVLSWAGQHGGGEDALGYALVAFAEAVAGYVPDGTPFQTALNASLRAHRRQVGRELPTPVLTASAKAWSAYWWAMRRASGDSVAAEVFAVRAGLDQGTFRRLYQAAHPASLDYVETADPIAAPLPAMADVLLVEACLAQVTELQREVLERMCGMVDRDSVPAVGYVSDRAIARRMSLDVGRVAELRSSALATIRAFMTALVEET